MKTLLKRLLGLGMLAAAGYAMWRAYERRKVDTRRHLGPAAVPVPAAAAHRRSERGHAAPSSTPAAETVAETGWIEPDAGACPTSHPVKAKLASGIFHVPGGANYDRTKPDRCYSSAEAAETDGLRPAKR